jgi:hypothetical protein
MSGVNWLYLGITSGMATCIGAILLAYNVIALVMFMREESEGSASGMAKGAWALGLVSVFMAGMPCIGSLMPFLPIILARVEKGRIYRDESPLAGATPVRLAGINGWIAFMLSALMMLGSVLTVVVASTAG